MSPSETPRTNAIATVRYPPELELSSLLMANGGDGSAGFVLNGAGAGGLAGLSVGTAGDVNADGVDDLIIGAPAAGTASSGDSYIVFGRRDTDGDGVVDTADNCSDVYNPNQRDSDGDGFGNACDADLNDDCSVNFLDLGIMKSVFLMGDPDADLDGDGAVNFVDLGIMKSVFFQSPGPSGLPNACDEN